MGQRPSGWGWDEWGTRFGSRDLLREVCFTALGRTCSTEKLQWNSFEVNFYAVTSCAGLCFQSIFGKKYKMTNILYILNEAQTFYFLLRMRGKERIILGSNFRSGEFDSFRGLLSRKTPFFRSWSVCVYYYFLLPISRKSIVFGSNFRNADFDGFTRFEVSWIRKSHF